MNIDGIKNVDMNITGEDIKHIKGLFISHLVGFWPCIEFEQWGMGLGMF